MDFTLQELYKEIGVEGQKKLCDKTVTIVGVGGVGSTVSQFLARNGINMRIVDKGRILDKDIPRISLFTIEDISKFKAKQVKKLLEEINDKVKVRTFHEDLTEQNVFLTEADLILDLSNDEKTNEIVNKFATDKKIPYIMANYVGDEGNILIVNDKSWKKKMACYNCLKDKLKLRNVVDAGIYSPITLILASLVISATKKILLDKENQHNYMHVNIMKAEIKSEKIEKDKKCELC
jgi:molybdopterin/thiamine biosynthesis adenylyltransferase